MDHPDAELTPERRARLAAKGRLLYFKFCGTAGRGVCAEGFALYHIWRGEAAVAADLLAFLDARVATLRAHDPDGRLDLTERLAARVRRRLREEAADETLVADGGSTRDALDERGLVGPIGPVAAAGRREGPS